MGYKLREFEAESKFSRELTLEAIGQAVPMDKIKAVLDEEEVKESPERKFNLVALSHRVCRPMATPETPGAFLFRLRLMAIDGTVEDAPDTLANVAVFGRHHSDRGQAAFPQIQGVYLAECGTHAIVDAGFWPCHTSERVSGCLVGPIAAESSRDSD